MQNNTTTQQQGAKTAPAAAQNEQMRFYNALREVPNEARKTITEGRLKGKTDVNPMWRIKRMTEIFGPCSIGWKYVITKQWLEPSGENTVAAFCNIDLYIKDPLTGTWGDPIPGTGGNVFRRKEGSGQVYTDDDCHKKALTDALSVAMKALGVAADIFYEQDTGKYTSTTSGSNAPQETAQQPAVQQPTVRPRPENTKPVLSPASPYWNQSIVIAMQSNDTFDQLRMRIEKKYTISNQDFNHLLRCAGKVTA